MLTRYRVAASDAELGRPLELDDALDVIRRRLRAAESGDIIRARKVLYELPPEAPPGSGDYTAAILQVYRATVLRFPEVGWAGGFVCRLTSSGGVSQHAIRTPALASASNAIDWTAPDRVRPAALVEWLWVLARWHVEAARAGELPISEEIFQDRKWTPAGGWRPYGGTFHATHVHTSAAPYRDEPAACLDG